MQLNIITKTGKKALSDVKIGDFLLCDDGIYRPVKSILLTYEYGNYIRTADNFNFHITKRVKIKTSKGFKFLEKWDLIEVDKNFTPLVVEVNNSLSILLYYDILIEGNLISPEGIIFRFEN